jgi:hypothetical protein
MKWTYIIAISKGVKLRTNTGIWVLFEDRQKFVATDVSLNQEEKMAVANSSGCAQGKNRLLFAPLERRVQLGVYQEDGDFRQGLAVRHTQPHAATWQP